MLKKRKQYNNEFKFRVSLEACISNKTILVSHTFNVSYIYTFF